MKKTFFKVFALFLATLMVVSNFISCGDGAGNFPQIEETKETETSQDPNCKHLEIKVVSSKAPTCTEEGNIAYCACLKCGKYFTDTTKVQELSAEEILIVANGHTEVIDEAIIPTYTSTGLTQGSHCSVCNEVIIKQIVSPQLTKDEYTIQYMCDMLPLDANGNAQLIPSDTYKPYEVKVLRTVQMDNYQFLGWSDKGGHFFGWFPPYIK